MVEMTVPENDPALLRYSFWQAATCTIEAQKQPKGPVQINFPLREPLLPDFSRQCSMQQDVSYLAPQQELSAEMITQLALTLRKRYSDCWRKPYDRRSAAVAGFSEKLGWPIVGDPLTNLATAGTKVGTFISQADLVFPQLTSAFQPEVVVRFGRLPVTKMSYYG